MKKLINLTVGLLMVGLLQFIPTFAAVNTTPRAFVAEGGVDAYSLHLLWVNPENVNLSHINIYLSRSALTDFGIAGTAVGAQAQSNQRGEYIITELTDQRNTTNYYYVYITAVDKTGVESAPTPTLKRQTGIFQDLTSTEPVANLTAAAVNASSLQLNWTNPIEDDLYQIKVYRSAVSPVSKIDTNLVASQTVLPNTVGKLIDINLITCTKYYYSVYTLDVAGNFSEPANISGTTLAQPTPPANPPTTPPTPAAPPTSETIPTVFPNPNNFSYAAQWISQSGTLSTDKTAHVVYAHAGDTLTFQLTLKNTGRSTWLADSTDNANEFRIGTWRSQDRTSQFQASDWLLTNRVINLSQNVASGGTVTLTWTMQVPANLAAGSYREYFRPVAEYCKWFGPDGIFWDIVVN